jgi:hypothetical protein
MKSLIPLALLFSAVIAAPAHAVMPVEIRELHIKVNVSPVQR